MITKIYNYIASYFVQTEVEENLDEYKTPEECKTKGNERFKGFLWIIKIKIYLKY